MCLNCFADTILASHSPLQSTATMIGQIDSRDIVVCRSSFVSMQEPLAHAREGKDQAQIGQYKVADERFVRLD